MASVQPQTFRRSHESIGSIHPETRGDDAIDGRARPGGGSSISSAAGLTIAASRFPHHFGLRPVAGRESGHHGFVRGYSLGASVRSYRIGNRNDVVEFAGGNQRDAAV